MSRRIALALLAAPLLLSDVVLAQVTILRPTGTAAPQPSAPVPTPSPSQVLRPGLSGSGRAAFPNSDSEAGGTSWLTGAGAALDPSTRQCRKRTVRSHELVINGQPPTSLGGDYWDVPFPATLSIGQQGECWQSFPGNLQGGARTPDIAVGSSELFLTVLARGNPRGGKARAELRDVGGAVLATAPIKDDVSVSEVRFDVTKHRNGKVRLWIVQDAGSLGVDVDAVTLWTGNPGALPPRGSGVAEPDGVWGFADLHVHPAAHLGFGGQNGPNQSLVFGATNANWASDWTACRHSGAGVNTSMLTEHLEPAGHAGTGYPAFQYWPRFNSVLHQQAHVNWLRRAWRGGLRLIVMHAVNNSLLARYFHPGDHADWANDMVSAKNQLSFLRQMIASSNFMEVAKDPGQARDIVKRGKLAVVLGVEIDSIGSCHESSNVLSEQLGNAYTSIARPCQIADVNRAVDELYNNYDVRHIFPMHLADNDFGGAALYRLEFAKFTAWERGVDFSPTDATKLAPPAPYIGVRLTAGHNFTDDFLAGLFGNVGMDHKSWPGGPHVNSRGLQPLGLEAILHMWTKGMVVEVDHMSEAMSRAVLQQAQARVLSVAAGHTMPRELLFLSEADADGSKLAAENNKSDDQIRALHARTAVIGVGTGPVDGQQSSYTKVPNRCAGSSTSWLQSYMHTVGVKQKAPTQPPSPGFIGVGLGTDMHLQGQLFPRFGSWACLGKDLGVISTAQDTKSPKREIIPADIDAQDYGVSYATAPFTYYSSRFQRPLGDGNAQSLPGRTPYLDGYVRNPTEAAAGRERAVWHGLYLWQAMLRNKINPMTVDLSSAWNWWHWTDGARHFAIGFGQSASQTSRDCHDVNPMTNQQVGGDGDACVIRRTAYLVKNGATVPDPQDHPAVRAGVARYLPMVLRVWQSFSKMLRGGNPNAPLQRCEGADCAGTREFDYNVDGLAHYGLVPDFLQDASNQLRAYSPAATGDPADLRALFRSAEDYIRMWELVWDRRGTPGRPPGM